jgi:uncharacterized protein
MKKSFEKNFFIVILILIYAEAKSQPAFNCEKAKSPSEKIICSDQELAAMDIKLNELVKAVRRNTSDIKNFNKDTVDAWKKRESQCFDRECVKKWYIDRIAIYSNDGINRQNKIDSLTQAQPPQRQIVSNTIATNFLIGLCEIPNQSNLNECTSQAIDLSDAPMGSYSIFSKEVIHYVVRSSFKVPEKHRIKNDFDIKVKYEIDLSGNNIITTTTDNSGTCQTKKLYKKQGETISVTRMEMSGSCDEVQKKNWALLDSQYLMKWRRIK